jgi:putative resolvase
VNLTEWARLQAVDPQTAYREGSLPVPAVRVNERPVLVTPDVVAEGAVGGVGLYARVCSPDQRDGLDRQVARLSEWAANAAAAVVRVEAELGSGMSGARRKVWRLLADRRVATVVAEHRDRLGPMNTEWWRRRCRHTVAG